MSVTRKMCTVWRNTPHDTQHKKQKQKHKQKQKREQEQLMSVIWKMCTVWRNPPHDTQHKNRNRNRNTKTKKNMCTVWRNTPHDTQRVDGKHDPGWIHGKKMMAHARSQAKMSKYGTMVAPLDRVRGAKSQLLQRGVAVILGSSWTIEFVHITQLRFLIAHFTK
jgi:hypothetical protein